MAIAGRGGFPAEDWTGAVYAVIILTGLLLVGFGAILLARRYLFRGRREGWRSLDLESLRKLQADGKISQGEYEQLRERILAQFGSGHKGEATK